MSGRVLIAEADDLLTLAVRLTLERANLEVTAITGTEDGAVVLTSILHPEAVVSNLWLAQGGNGVAAARRYVPAVGCIPLFLSAHPAELRPMNPPPCLCPTAVALTAGDLLAAVSAALHWHRHGHPPDILPRNVTVLGSSS